MAFLRFSIQSHGVRKHHNISQQVPQSWCSVFEGLTFVCKEMFTMHKIERQTQKMANAEIPFADEVLFLLAKFGTGESRT